MKNSRYFTGLYLWIEGFLLLALRWMQLKNGFDPETGLARQSPAGVVLAAALLILAVVEAVRGFRLPGGKRSYACCFRPAEGPELPLLAAGSLLLGGGGVLLAAEGLQEAGPSVLAAATAAAGVAAAAGILLFARQTRSGGGRVLPLLPAMVFSVLFLLLVYLPQESNPVLARYYLPVLAAALTACAFYQLAGFSCREASMRWFAFFGELAVPVSLAALADGVGNWGEMLVYTGCAMALTVFLLLRRADPLPEPAEETPEETAE